MRYDPNNEYPDLPLEECRRILMDARLWDPLVQETAAELPFLRGGHATRLVFTAMALYLNNAPLPSEAIFQPTEEIAKAIRDYLPSAKILLQDELYRSPFGR